MLEKVTTILAKYTDYPIESMKKDTSLITDITLNSLDYVKAIMDIEDELDIEVPEDAIRDITTIGELVKYIEDLVED